MNWENLTTNKSNRIYSISSTILVLDQIKNLILFFANTNIAVVSDSCLNGLVQITMLSGFLKAVLNYHFVILNFCRDNAV